MLYVLYNGAIPMNEQSKIAADARGQVIGTVEIKKIGNSSGIILSKDVLAALDESDHHAQPGVELGKLNRNRPAPQDNQ